MVRRAGMDGALLGAIDRQSRVAPQAYEILREAIISMRLRPGVALSENEIAKQIGTSRTPVREAFIRLADEGHVVVVPQLGTFVAPIDLAEVVEAGTSGREGTPLTMASYAVIRRSPRW